MKIGIHTNLLADNVDPWTAKTSTDGGFRDFENDIVCKKVSILFAILLSITGPLAFATPATDAIEADQDLVDRVTGARQREVDEQLKKFQEKMMKLPDDKRDRFGGLNEEDVLVEKASNMRMRMDKAKFIEKGKTTDIAEYKFIENGKIYGFYGGKIGNCQGKGFNVLKNSKSWIIFLDRCLNNSVPKGDRRTSAYSWMLYDRKHHVLVDLDGLFSSKELESITKNYPKVTSYNDGKYALYYPYLKDTQYFDIKKPGNGGCYWKSDKKNNDDDDLTGNECYVNSHDLIEDGVPEKH